MVDIPGLDRIQKFVMQFSGVGILSTGSNLVYFSGDLYNVQGSTEDPKGLPDHKGSSWKQLLIEDAGLDDAHCYVTNVNPPSESSHPDFSVGGHMTTNRDGIVEVGADSYLMPLCRWHNSTARDGMRFEHSEMIMLKLTGYMQGELASTFELRREASEPFSLLYFDLADGNWKHRNLPKDQALKIGSKTGLPGGSESESSNAYVLFERTRKVHPLHFIKEVNLPE